MKQSNQRLATQIAKDVELDYLLYLPEETPATPPPLLLFLHGVGERGSDVAKVKENGLPARLENGLELPFVVVAPQCPADSWWETDSLTALLDTVLDQHDIGADVAIDEGDAFGVGRESEVEEQTRSEVGHRDPVLR